MSRTDSNTNGQAAMLDGPEFNARVDAIGANLAHVLRAVMAHIPGAPHRPTALARTLGTSRVLLSRLLKALSKPSAVETLYHLPGPESLRAIVRAASDLGPHPDTVHAAGEAIDQFDTLIREEFGTRAALDAMISAQLPGAREQFEASSRYDVFKGMSQLLGTLADVWVTSMLLHPCADDPERLDIALIHGALGVRCLRPDASVSFRFGSHAASGAPTKLDSMSFDRFYMNPPASVRASVHGDELVHTLENTCLGRRSLVDMLVADHHAAAVGRYADPGPRNKRGGTVLPDFPVKLVSFDMLLHKDVFPGSTPELMVYNTCLRGPASVNDPARDPDRLDVRETIESPGSGRSALHNDDVPNYVSMLETLCDQLGWDLSDFRLHRCRMHYPVYGWQMFMAFDAPMQG